MKDSPNKPLHPTQQKIIQLMTQDIEKLQEFADFLNFNINPLLQEIHEGIIRNQSAGIVRQGEQELVRTITRIHKENTSKIRKIRSNLQFVNNIKSNSGQEHSEENFEFAIIYKVRQILSKIFVWQTAQAQQYISHQIHQFLDIKSE